MFSVDIKINNKLISKIIGQNLGECRSVKTISDGKHKYLIEYHTFSPPEIKSFKIKHKREAGIEILVKKVLEKVIEK